MKHDGYLLMKMLYYKLWTSNVSLWSVVREAGSRVDIQRVGVGIRNWGRHELLHGYYHVFQNWCGVSSVSGLLDDSMETGVFVSSVTHSANGAIRFYQLVVTFDFIAVTFLSLFFDIVSVWILHSVLEFVMRRSLKLLKVILTYLLTYILEPSPSFEANWHSTSQEIPWILWNPKVHYRIHKCLPPVPIMSQIYLFHAPILLSEYRS